MGHLQIFIHKNARGKGREHAYALLELTDVLSHNVNIIFFDYLQTRFLCTDMQEFSNTPKYQHC